MIVMTLTRWQRPALSTTYDPFEQLSHLREEVNRLFESPFGGLTQAFNEWSPAIDLYEDKNNVVVKAELPGMKKEEIDVSLREGALTISGERKFEHEEGKKGETYRSERFFGRFQRSVMLPTEVDESKVSAAYKDGILTITLPKSEKAKPKQIEVSVK
jgi:HSP20 family protein